MPYATRQDIIDRLPDGQDGLLLLADRDGDGAEDPGVVDGALKDASDEIDTYVGSRYALPLPSVPPSLVRLAVDIAIYRMARDAARATDESRLRYTDVVRLLERIAKGDVKLGLPDGEAPAAQSVAEFAAQPRRFRRGKMP